MLANELWKRIVYFVLAFGIGVLVKINYSDTDNRSFESVTEPSAPLSIATERSAQWQRPLRPDCVPGYTVVPLTEYSQTEKGAMGDVEVGEENKKPRERKKRSVSDDLVPQIHRETDQQAYIELLYKEKCRKF